VRKVVKNYDMYGIPSHLIAREEESSVTWSHTK